ncbi:Alpha-1,3-mannosyltransferase-like protein [Myotisia sp. PD_48]|nr:Alpha-1,3-mannosyltransferase-like protein [Myotisia sp. PD_48]
MAQMPSSSRKRKRNNVVFIHPDLGIGGAERLILDAALALQSHGHQVTIYTSHRDKNHCFEEARDGTLDVRVHSGMIPAHVCGRFYVAMAVLRQLYLVGWVVKDITGNTQPATPSNKKQDRGNTNVVEQLEADDVFIVDQVPACIPLLRWLRATMISHTSKRKVTRRKGNRRRRQRVLFYCHFPDQLLSRRDEGGALIRLLKGLYRYPFDWFEGWAMSAADKIVVNSKFTKGVVGDVFGNISSGLDVSVVYPCVDTAKTNSNLSDAAEDAEDEKPVLWGGRKILLSINRFERKKNIDLAIRAYHGLSEKERKGTRLVIAGGYDNRVAENFQYHKYLEELAASLGFTTATSKTVMSALSIPDSIDILFLLSVPSAFKQTLLLSASLLLYTPSHEHFGIVPVEAMHAGLPVLAVNTGGPLETIVEGNTGWLRDSNNVNEWTAVIRKVLTDMTPAQLNAMGKCGKERVEKKFSLSAMGDRLEHEIEEMIETDDEEYMNSRNVFLIGFGLIVGLLLALGLRIIS